MGPAWNFQRFFYIVSPQVVAVLHALSLCLALLVNSALVTPSEGQVDTTGKAAPKSAAPPPNWG